jgi:hypothetical protein
LTISILDATPSDGILTILFDVFGSFSIAAPITASAVPSTVLLTVFPTISPADTLWLPVLPVILANLGSSGSCPPTILFFPALLPTFLSGLFTPNHSSSSPESY